MGGDLAAVKEVRLGGKITYHGFGPIRDLLSDSFKPFVFVLRWLVDRSGVGGMVEVIVQALRENVEVLLLEPLAPFLHELELWRKGVGH